MGEPFSANAREPKNSGLWNFPSLPATEFIFPSRSCCSQVVAVVLLLRRTATAMRNTTFLEAGEPIGSRDETGKSRQGMVARRCRVFG
jgi:hypothetical protein